MAADVEVRSYTMPRKMLAKAMAKGYDLNLTEEEYVCLCVDICNELPADLLFVLSSGVAVNFSATAFYGERDDG